MSINKTTKLTWISLCLILFQMPVVHAWPKFFKSSSNSKGNASQNTSPLKRDETQQTLNKLSVRHSTLSRKAQSLREKAGMSFNKARGYANQALGRVNKSTHGKGQLTVPITEHSISNPSQHSIQIEGVQSATELGKKAVDYHNQGVQQNQAADSAQEKAGVSLIFVQVTDLDGKCISSLNTRMFA